MTFPVRVVVVAKADPAVDRTLEMKAQMRAFLDEALANNETDDVVYEHQTEPNTFYRQFASLEQAGKFKSLILMLDRSNPDNAVIETVVIETV